jgi:hypothetical protein
VDGDGQRPPAVVVLYDIPPFIAPAGRRIDSAAGGVLEEIKREGAKNAKKN